MGGGNHSVIRSRLGFTLVELIIVIAVIGVLAAILIPVFSNVIAKANEKSARSDARNAVSQYMIDATEDRTLPNDIVIMVFKAGKCYLYGYDTESPDGLVCSVQNSDPTAASTPAEVIDTCSYNRLVNETPAPDENATYNINTDGAFYLTVHPELRSIRGASFTTIPGTGYMQIETSEHNDNTAIFDGFLLPGTYETDVQSSADAGNTNTSTSAPAATQAPTAEPTPTATQEPTPTATAEPTPTPTYTVTYHANNASGDTHDETCYEGASHDIIANPFSYEGHTFKYFTEGNADTGTHYKSGTDAGYTHSITVNANMHLYAQWQLNTYTITFTDGTHSASYTATHGVAVQLATVNPLTPDTGYELDYFTIGGADYQSDASHAFTAAATVTVHWKTTITGGKSQYPSGISEADAAFIVKFVDTSASPNIVSQSGMSAMYQEGQFVVATYDAVQEFDSVSTQPTQIKIKIANLQTHFGTFYWPNINLSNDTAYGIIDSNGNIKTGGSFVINRSEVTNNTIYVAVGAIPPSANVVFHPVTEPAILPSGEQYMDR